MAVPTSPPILPGNDRDGARGTRGMTMNNAEPPAVPRSGRAEGADGRCSLDTLRAEIAFFEARIAQMDDDGDSAYEKRLIRTYHSLIRQRRKAMEALSG
jgi:hypothetical protein